MLALVVDTNLFHEFRSLELLPWCEITDEDEVILLVSDPVQTELDEQKKSPRARIKRRALGWVKRFRELLKADETDLVLVEGSPRVVLRLDDTRPSKDHSEVLDLTVPDDAIVAIAVTHVKNGQYEKIAIFSEDLRPMRKARQVSLEFIEIPEEWRREAEQTEEDREKQRLKDQLAMMMRQEPNLTLSCSMCSPTELILPVYEPLCDDQLGELMALWAEWNPIETNFERAKASRLATGIQAVSLGLGHRKFQAASEDEIEQYRNERYPAWLERCREELSLAHKSYSYIEQSIAISVELENRGTRPAEDLQITFTAKGGLAIMPNSSIEGEEGEEDEIDRAPSFDLPTSPAAPQGKWVTIDPFRSMLDRQYTPGSSLRHPFVGPTLQDVIRDSQRDPNFFYYRSIPSEPVASYSLTCAQFRHAGAPKAFEIVVRPVGENVNDLTRSKNSRIRTPWRRVKKKQPMGR